MEHFKSIKLDKKLCLVIQIVLKTVGVNKQPLAKARGCLVSKLELLKLKYRAHKKPIERLIASVRGALERLLVTTKRV